MLRKKNTYVHELNTKRQKRAEDSNPKPFEDEVEVLELVLFNTRTESTESKSATAYCRLGYVRNFNKWLFIVHNSNVVCKSPLWLNFADAASVRGNGPLTISYLLRHDSHSASHIFCENVRVFEHRKCARVRSFRDCSSALRGSDGFSVFVSHSHTVCRAKFQNSIRQTCHSDINICTHTEIFKWTVDCPVVAVIRCCTEINVVRSMQQCCRKKFGWRYKRVFSWSDWKVLATTRHEIKEGVIEV